VIHRRRDVVDRVVQQAVLQILEPIFEPTFHPSSHGFRPHRGAHTAIAQAKEHLEAGYQMVVHFDLSKFLDRVSYCTQVHEAWLKRSVCEQFSLRRKPFLRPRLTWMGHRLRPPPRTFRAIHLCLSSSE
jgi:Reverse transcriptase (RNA-dependent DNA polymerase)